MIGLLMKDLMCIKKVALIMAGVSIIIALSFNSGMESMLLAPCLICASLVGTAQSYDGECGWYSYATATGIDRKSLIAEKYVLGLIATAIGVVSGLVGMVIYWFIEPWDISALYLAAFMAMGFVGSFLTIGISLFVDLRFGNGYTGVVYAFTIGAIVALVLCFGMALRNEELLVILMAVSAVIAVLNVALMLLNFRTIERKDF